MRGPRSAQSGGQTTGANQGPKPKRRNHRADFDTLAKIGQQSERGRGPHRPTEGMAAALQEYRTFKAAGMLAQWRERWRHILQHRHK